MIELILITISVLFLIYFTGFLITILFSLRLADEYERFLVSIIAGLVTLVFVYSVFKTRGNTVNLLIPVPFFLFLCCLKNKDKKTNNPEPGNMLKRLQKEMRPLSIAIIFCIIWFAWQYLPFINHLKGDPVYSPFADSVFYSDIVYSLRSSGSENTNTIMNDFANLQNERTPYHFFELWLSAGISSLYGVNSLVSFILVTPVIFFTVNSILIHNLARHFKLNSVLILLSPLLIFFVPFIIHYPFISEMVPGRFLSRLDNYIYSPTSIVKFQVYLFFILGIVYFYFRHNSAFIFFALLLPAATFTSVPSVVGLVCAYLLSRLIKKNTDRNFWFAILTTFIIVTFLGFYYRQEFASQREGTSAISSDAGYIGTIVNIAGGTVLQFFYIYGPYFILLQLVAWLAGKQRLLYSRENVRLYIFFVTAFVFGLGAWSLIHRQLDSHQFFSNFFMSAMIVLFVLQVLQIIRASGESKLWLRGAFYIAITGFIIYCGTWNYKNHREADLSWPLSRFFYDKVNNVLSSVSNKTGVCFYGSEDYKRIPGILNSFIIWPAQIFKFTHEKYYVASLSGLFQSYENFNSLEKERNEALQKNSVFAMWLEEKKVSDTVAIANMTQLQISFIKENKIRFAFASKDAIVPPEIEAMKEQEINDSISGYRFFLFNDL